MSRISGNRQLTSKPAQILNNIQTVTGADKVTIGAPSTLNLVSAGDNVLVNSYAGNIYLNTTNLPIPTTPTQSVVVVSDFVISPTDSKFVDNSTINVGNPGLSYVPPPFGQLYDTPAHRMEGSAYFAGGVGIEKDLNVGGWIWGRVSEAVTSTFSTRVFVESASDNQEYYPLFTDSIGQNSTASILYGDLGTNPTHLRYNPSIGRLTLDNLYVTSDVTSTASTIGAVIVDGGIGVAKDIAIGGVVYATNDFTSQYLENVYSNYLGYNSSKSTLALGAGMTDVFGDIRVRGKNPIGTAPTVTNTLYVTVDGDDTNDGRAIDPSRACRTIGGALKSPYYQPGTQILVSAGRYLENNPLVLKPYTSIRGSDIRTTFIEPINKTQDLFHLNSGCYLNYMTFLNGRSGRLEGPYAPGFNRGAYATAFPPQTGDARIDLFHSPYIQNCTNQSGPWLKDGTMFVPDQTVQVPQAVGIGSWEYNTASIVINVTTGTLSIGQYINPGQQNQGFFNARTLLLANKPFLQSQVVAFVDKTFNSGTFTYNQPKCQRDTALIIQAISNDMLFNSTSDSTFAGLQYWNQNGYTGQIPAEITYTINAITHLRSLAQATVSPANQASVGSLFNVILNILNNGTAGVTDQIIYGGLPSTDPALQSDVTALQAAKPTLQQQVVDYVNASLSIVPYNNPKCARDTGLIVDALAQDLLFGGTSQSDFAGLQYWNQNGYTGQIPAEITETVAAINYASSLSQDIVQNITNNVTRYTTVETQNTNLRPGTVLEANTIAADFSVITNILNNGTNGVTDIIVPNGLTPKTGNVLNAYNVLQANKSYIQAQTVAYVEATKPVGFFYDQVKCRRDVGYIIDSISFDLLYGGNRQAVQSGVYYYAFSTTGSAVAPAEIPQVTAAYEYIKTLASYIVKSIPIPYPFQSSVSQVLTGLIGTDAEISLIDSNIDRIVSIINTGPTGITPSPIPQSQSNNFDVQNAAAILELNRSFIQAEVVAYINNYGWIYNPSICKRDVGYIIDSISSDLLNGSNIQSIKSGVYYYGFNGSSTAIPNEIPQTTAAYNFIKSIIPDIVTGKTILSPYQTAVPQIVSINAGTSYEVATLQNNLDVITGIIRNGPSAAGPKIPIGLVENTATSVINAFNLLRGNIPFIQAEVLAYIDTTLNNFTYNRELCYRDVAILVENMSYDMAFGGNEKSVENGKAYYRGVTSVIAGQETQTISAIDYLSFLCQQIVNNQVCPILTPPASIPVASQVINTALTGGEIAISSINHLFNITTNIIANGPNAAPQLYNSPGPESAYVDAEILLQANRSFIQENVINYINYNLCQPPKALPYNQIKCRRDSQVIIDSIASDLLFGGFTQSTFAGLQYFNQAGYTGNISTEINPTIEAVKYLRDLSIKVVQNITTATDALVGIFRYTSGVQITSPNPATSAEVITIGGEFNIILDILGGNTKGWTDKIIPNGGVINPLSSVQNTVELLQLNKIYLADEIVASVTARNPGFVYSTSTCHRDVGYIIDSISFDLLYGGNRLAIQSGLSYYASASQESVIPQETAATVDAFGFIGSLSTKLITGVSYSPIQSSVTPVLNLPLGSATDAAVVVNAISTITNIITNGPGVAAPLTPTGLIANPSYLTQAAFNILKANREFIAAETIAYLDNKYNAGSFTYNQDLCYRDTGLIIDAVSQDILLGGNQKSIEAGLSYWNKGYSYVTNQLTTTTSAINYARDLSLMVMSNIPVTAVTGTIATQVINPFFSNGGTYMPKQAVQRNFNIITDIINNGPQAAPPLYAGGGLFSLTGLNGSDVKNSPSITSINQIDATTYRVGLSTSTVGFGNNATLYFGKVYVFPLQDAQVEAKSLEYTGNPTTWNQRKLDPVGSMGGSLVDGAVISDRSPIQSFVYDAFTQVNQGGIGMHITNNGYAQLVSVFTIFCSIGVLCDNGGIASITNSNCNFGDQSLVAKGYGRRDFSGTVYNPSYRAYPFSPNVPGSAYLDQFYPEGYWPNKGNVEIFVPDSANRPHIGQVMEIIPPEGHINEQGLLGFLNAQPSTSTLTTGTIVLGNISITDIYIGNFVYIRDQFGRQHDDNGVMYATTGTYVTDVNYNAITLNYALTSGGGDPTNPTYFTLYFCGNSYYTVQTSLIANSPYALGNNILSANVDPYYQGPAVSQVAAHVASIQHLNQVVDQIINNIQVIPTPGNTLSQVINTNVVGGESAQSFIDLRFTQLINIVNAPDIATAESVVPANLIVTSGTVPTGAGSAITLIQSNIDFLAAEIVAFVNQNYPTEFNGSMTDNQKDKCARDVKLILQQLIYDLQSGGNYNMVFSGLSYWARSGTYHIVTLGEAVTRPDLFPDGSTANFYQRSYISASGYLFEYVGAGTNYGALPQRGVADPVQSKETIQLNSGKVFFTSTDQNGDFRIGPGLVISQATGVLSGRTFVQSLYANMTPFILAIE